MKKFIYFLAIAFTSLVFSQQKNEQLFSKAADLYNEGKYQEAVENYLEITKSGVHSASLYYNLGNSYYKLNKVAPSIYYYEKALLLDPDDHDIKNNLQYAQNMTVDAIQTLPKSVGVKISENTFGLFHYETWSILAVIMVFLFTFFFLTYYFSSYRRIKKLLFSFSIIAVIIGAFCLFSAYHQHQKDRKDNPAIVFIDETAIKSEPNNRSDDIFTLHEGTKVNVLETLGDWDRIKLTDGKTGWIPKEDIRLLKDF